MPDLGRIVVGSVHEFRPRAAPPRAWSPISHALRGLSDEALRRIAGAEDCTRWQLRRGDAELAGALSLNGWARSLAGHAEDVYWRDCGGSRQPDMRDPQWDHEDDARAADAAFVRLADAVGLPCAARLVRHRAARLLDRRAG